MPGRKISQGEFHKIFHAEIDQSVEQEKRDANGATQATGNARHCTARAP
jgi:hypothetical protein